MSKKQNQEQVQEQLQSNNATRRFDAFLAVVIDSVTSLFNNRPAQAAASIAYYFLFSVFPLILFTVIVLSYFIDVNYVQSVLERFVRDIIPGAELLISENLQTLLANRGSTSILASISLLWSGSGMINGLIYNVQLAFPETNTRGFFINRAFAIIGIILAILLVGGMLVFSVVFNLSDALAVFNVSLTKGLSTTINIITKYILPTLFLYLFGFVLYYVTPAADVDREGARIAALFFAIVWRIYAHVFGNYLLSPMNRYDLIYGSVTVIVLVLLFIYFSAFIILYPAHLAAAITHYKQRRTGIIAAAPINPESVQPKAPQRGKKKKKSAPDSEKKRTLNDPVYLDPNIGPPPDPPVYKQIWGIITDLFRWK